MIITLQKFTRLKLGMKFRFRILIVDKCCASKILRYFKKSLSPVSSSYSEQLKHSMLWGFLIIALCSIENSRYLAMRLAFLEMKCNDFCSKYVRFFCSQKGLC